MIKRMSGIVVALGLLCIAGYVSAAVLNVPAQYPTIQGAINASHSGDEVVVAPGTYQESIIIDSLSVTVRSTQPTDSSIVSQTIIKAAPNSPAVAFGLNQIGCALRGFTVTNATNSGVWINCNGTTTVANNIITGNKGAGVCGGGIHCQGSGNFAITDNTIKNNSALNQGGGITCINASPTISGNTIDSNTAGMSGGGIYCEGQSSHPKITKNTITGNKCQAKGAGICCTSQSAPTITDNQITGNSASPQVNGIVAYGGGIYLDNTASNTTVGRNSIANNIARMGGGVAAANNVSAALDANTINSNNAVCGAGVYFSGGKFFGVGNCTITANKASSNGGGIYAEDTSGTIGDCTISGNTAVTSGGGVYMTASSSAQYSPNFLRCIVSGNDSPSGAGVYLTGTKMASMYQDLVCGNHGEGVTVTDVVMDIMNCTIANNTGTGVRGNLVWSSCDIGNSIIAFNGEGINGTLSGPSYSDVYGNHQKDYVGQVKAGDGTISVDPLFYDAAHSNYALCSTGGVQVSLGKWVATANSSPCLDAGNPKQNASFEPQPNGGRINMGWDGGSARASRSAGQAIRTINDTTVKSGIVVNTGDIKPVPGEIIKR